MPFRGNREAYDISVQLTTGETGKVTLHTPNNRAIEFAFVDGIRTWNGGSTTVEFREHNQADGRYVGGDGTWNGGKPICRMTFGSAGVYTPNYVTWYVENYPNGFFVAGIGSFLSLQVISGTISGNLEGKLCFRRPTLKTIDHDTANKSNAASGATATFTVVGTQSPIYRWQLKPPADHGRHFRCKCRIVHNSNSR